MTNDTSLAERLAANRAAGQVSASAQALFDARHIPAWAELDVGRYVKVVWISLALYVISLALIVSSLLQVYPYVINQWLALLAFASLNYCVLISAACVIQHKLHGAGLQQHGAGLALLLGLVLNPLVLGWLVPVYALSRAADARRQLNARQAAGPRG